MDDFSVLTQHAKGYARVLTLVFLSVCAPLLAASASTGTSPAMHVAFINPDQRGNPFWDQVVRFMEAVADDLAIELDVHYANGNRFASYELAKAAMHAPDAPDFLMFNYQYGSGKAILDEAETRGIHSFIFNTSVDLASRAQIGQPREKYRYWLGQLQPDDLTAGRLLASNLITQSRKRQAEREAPIGFIAISGSNESSAGPDRSAGMEGFVQGQGDVVLNRHVYARWQPELAVKQARTLFGIYPASEVLWTASDAMALAIIADWKQNQPATALPLIGGMDWTPSGLAAIAQGDLAASVGGHFMEGGWGLLLLHDYFHGFDFAELGLRGKTPMHLIDQRNVGRYQVLLTSDFQTINFRRFSRKHNPKWRSYPFEDELISQRIAALLHAAAPAPKSGPTKARQNAR